jgi:hypothetical protein
MGEGSPVDDALSGIVVDVDALELAQELVAVLLAGSEPAGLASLGERALDPVFAQGMGACPFRRLAAVLALNARFERGGAGDRGKNAGGARRIVAGGDQVSKTERVGLIFLVAREAEGRELGTARSHFRDRIAETAADDAAEDRSEDSKDAAPLRIGFARLLVIGGDVADLVAEREGELRLIVHQRHQLAGDVDVAARRREGVLDRGIEDRESIGSGIDPRIDGDPAADAVDIGCSRTGFGSPEFLDELGMLLLRFLHISRRQNAARDLCGRERRTGEEGGTAEKEFCFAHYLSHVSLQARN